ncbi:nitrate reductase [Candidatus Poribacteria bacterium]|nr:nitrate reductase [Candidatus Poribacteria bacterium]MBT5534731.1 nitrate reductase [Candidatus Poribacteria bacterium]MBT5712972.1 nitrate reductase [Candidatus Poribacteria bacterium]MBT7100959.1 nitrate reductase [Candidatus Poribacteria bacterium]MBT7809018.1 nitrate reductase [Candidatus Poribacteria bacterium]
MSSDRPNTVRHARRWPHVTRVVALFALVATPQLIAALEPNAECLRCHGMATLGYQDPATGVVASLHVDIGAYTTSNHAELGCVACHTADYSDFPHSDTVRDEDLRCLDCHDDDERLERFRLDEIGESFARSVHASRHAGAFTCFDCHDPHAFDVARDLGEVADVVRDSNAICLNCHQSGASAGLAALAPTALDVAHAWLPNAELHGDHVRCLDCHTPDDPASSHEILAAEDARRSCVDCHTAGSVLLTKLYRHRVRDGRTRAGFINAAVFNDAYIIGMTRNVALDRVSVGAFVAVLVAIAAHAVGRSRAAGKAGR